MTTVVKTPEAQDFLALVPQLAGFHPSRSIILVAFRGNRTCAAMRFDLPQPASPKAYRSIATSLIGMLCKIRGADALVPVAYTDERFAEAGGVPHRAFIDVLVARAELSGFLVRDALCVAADGWGSYLDKECPSGGRPLDQITSSSVATAGLRQDLGKVDDGADLPTADFATSERVSRQLRRYRKLEADIDAEEFDRERALLSELPLLMEFALRMERKDIDDQLAALLILALSSPPVRDATLLLWAFDLEVGHRAFDDNDRFLAGLPPEDDNVVAYFWGDGPRPDPSRIATAIGLLKFLAANAPPSRRPALLCMLGWLNWALGRSSLAAQFVTLAEGIDRSYGLAEVLRGMISAGHLPEWAFDVPEIRDGDGDVV